MTSLPTIPDEYREKAGRLVYGLLGYSADAATREEDIMSIARALVEEREVCAKIAEESYFLMSMDWWLKSTKKEVSEFTALSVASAIRNSTHPIHSAAAPLEAR
jgi:hypothetical protein